MGAASIASSEYYLGLSSANSDRDVAAISAVSGTFYWQRRAKSAEKQQKYLPAIP